MKAWIEKHPDLWEFIKFNILSNISTIARFILTWAGTALFINGMKLVTPFRFLILTIHRKAPMAWAAFLPS